MRKILLDINAKKYPIEIKAELWYKKVHFKLNKNAIMVNGIINRTMNFSNLCFVAGFIEINLKKGWALIGNTIIVEPDINKKIQNGINIWNKKKIWWDDQNFDKLKGIEYNEFKDIHMIGSNSAPKIKQHKKVKKDINTIKEGRRIIKILYNAGYHTRTQIAKEKLNILNQKTGLGLKICKDIIEKAKKRVNLKK